MGDNGADRLMSVIRTPPAAESRRRAEEQSVFRQSRPSDDVAASAKCAALFRPMVSRPSIFKGSPSWQSEDAFADDVALDLAGAAGDRVLPRPEHPVRPARRIRHSLGLGFERRVRSK